ncbi:MAG: hypothetical protein V3R83_12310 [Gammaproteobacteria bacterium]
MVEKTTTHCDECGVRVDYRAANGHRRVSGMTIDGCLNFMVHIVTNPEHSNVRVASFNGTHICSPGCLDLYFSTTVREFKEKWDEHERVDIKDGGHVKTS